MITHGTFGMSGGGCCWGFSSVVSRVFGMNIETKNV